MGAYSVPPAAGVAGAFFRGEMDLSARAGAPTPGWEAMPECVTAAAVRSRGGNDADVRLVVTFTAAMDRARDADRLWAAAARLHEAAPWTYDPQRIAQAPLLALADALRKFGVTQRHGPDAAAWRIIGEALADRAKAPAVRDAVYAGRGDAAELLRALDTTTDGGTHLFPFLRGPKVGPMWVRMLAEPGRAEIDNLGVVPVAVDVQVRRVTEYLAVAETGHLDLEAARPLVQEAWRREVADSGAPGPAAVVDTPGAVDPALWFWGKRGCSHCERAGRKVPVAPVCARCRFPHRTMIATAQAPA